MPSEQQQFLDEVKDENKVDAFEAPLAEPVTPEKDEEDPEQVAEEVKNRRHKRLEEKLRVERESNIALAERVKVLSETQKFKNDVSVDDDLHAVLYGANAPTDETRAVAARLQKVLEKYSSQSEERALSKFEEKQAEIRAQEKTETARLDSMVEDIEDHFGVSLNEEQQKAFFRRLERVSPKDEDGNVKDYADHLTVYEDLAASVQARKAENPAKNLSSRSMVKSGTSGDSKLQDDSALRFLKSEGII